MREQFPNAFLETRFRHARHAAEETEVVLCAKPFVEARMFEQRSRAAADFPALRLRIEAERGGAAACGFDQSEQQSNSSRFSRAVGAEETEHRTGRDIESDIIEGAHLPEGACQSSCLDCQVRHVQPRDLSAYHYDPA